MIKAVTTFKRRPDLSVEAFRRHWRTDHAALVTELPGLRRYVQNHAHDSAYARGREPDFDGIAETWFDDSDAMRAVAASDAYAAVRADEPNFIDVAGTRALLACREVVRMHGAELHFGSVPGPLERILDILPDLRERFEEA